MYKEISLQEAIEQCYSHWSEQGSKTDKKQFVEEMDNYLSYLEWEGIDVTAQALINYALRAFGTSNGAYHVFPFIEYLKEAVIPLHLSQITKKKFEVEYYNYHENRIYHVKGTLRTPNSPYKWKTGKAFISQKRKSA